MLMEYAEGGDLRDFISKSELKRAVISELEIWRICRMVCEGLVFLHAKGIIHMDIKP